MMMMPIYTDDRQAMETIHYSPDDLSRSVSLTAKTDASSCNTAVANVTDNHLQI